MSTAIKNKSYARLLYPVKALSYAFLGFSIIFIGYLLIETALNYPPKMIGISP